MAIVNTLVDVLFGSSWRRKGQVFHFEDILPVEFADINVRRARGGRAPIAAFGGEPIDGFGKPLTPEQPPVAAEAQDADAAPPAGPTMATRGRSPDPARLFAAPADAPAGSAGAAPDKPGVADFADPDRSKMRPRPVPCTATGLALSGGGVRSAAVCLGAIQALEHHRLLDGIDYLSTVSGGGYAGSSLSAAMSAPGGGTFPFGGDVADSPAIAHLRNYSNYLMPRGRNSARNLAEPAVLILRGIVANALIVSTFLLFAAAASLGIERRVATLAPLAPALWVAGALVVLLLIWAALRAYVRLDDEWTGDTRGALLEVAHWLLIAAVLLAVAGVQPYALAGARWLAGDHWHGSVTWGGVLAGLAAGVTAFSGGIGRFLEASRRSARWRTVLLRVAGQAAVVLAACVLPLLLWGVYLWLWATAAVPNPVAAFALGWAGALGWTLTPEQAYLVLGLVGLAMQLALTPNAYSLHRFYRDRLSKAFLFAATRQPGSLDPEPLDDLRLSGLAGSAGPYHLITAALNVQGSADANRRGRDADFFLFSPRFVGSDLTFYGAAGPPATPDMKDAIDMERADPRLDLATAMAISGAAISANMGSSTLRLLSPTLALLNVRLGYWLPNPRWLAGRGRVRRALTGLARGVTENLFLAREMLNTLDETRHDLLLTDGGHIENLGIYELLKRGCRLVIAIDAEADPTLSFGSLLRLERYARIDLGVRIVLPWEEIAERSRAICDELAAGRRTCGFGPHGAVGRIVYEDGTTGMLLYFKATLTGDEKDYILDYKKRHPDFPHENTGDQFFTEEQFEMYRALGFHMVAGFADGSDAIAANTRRRHPADIAALRGLILSWLHGQG